MIRHLHGKVGRALPSIIDSLSVSRHSSGMLQRTIISKLIKTLFCVTLLFSLVLYPPSSAHAHASAHGGSTVQDTDHGHHGGHGAHAHHDIGDAQSPLNAMDSDTSSDAPNCCQGICMAAVIAQSPSVLQEVNRAGHEATWLSSFSAFDPFEHRRPPKHLI